MAGFPVLLYEVRQAEAASDRLEKPTTTLGHGSLPYPTGTLVRDTISERTGHLVGVLEERTKEGNKVVSRQAFMRPEGGGVEWDVPLERIKPVDM